jgi:hypothetical protein
MADGLSTGIALSGQLKVDDSAQQNLLQAEKAAAEERLAKQAALDKEQKDLEKEISKTLFMAQKAIQPINQQRSEKIATSGVAKIISGMKSGDLGIADIYREAGAVQSKLNAVTEYDKQITDAIGTYAKDPGSYGKKTVTIKGVDYDSVEQAINDPALTPKDIADAYGTTEFAVINNPLLGEELLAYSPRKRVSPYTFLQDSKILLDDNNYTERFEGAPIRKPGYGDETIIPTGRRLNPELIGGVVKTMLNNEGVLDFYTDEVKKINPDIREGTPEMIAAIEDMANNEMLPFLRKQERKDPNMTFTPTVPKEAKKSLHDTKYNVSPTTVIDYGNKTANRKTFNAIGTPGSIPMYVPKDAVAIDEDGKPTASEYRGTNTEVSPIGIEWKDGRLNFLVSIKSDEENTTVFVPASQGVFSTVAAGLYLNTPEERGKLVQYIKDVVGDDPKALEKGFWKGLGVTDDQIKTVAGFGASPAKPSGPTTEEDEDFEQYAR